MYRPAGPLAPLEAECRRLPEELSSPLDAGNGRPKAPDSRSRQSVVDVVQVEAGCEQPANIRPTVHYISVNSVDGRCRESNATLARQRAIAEGESGDPTLSKRLC